MAQYTYKAVNQQGSAINGSIEAVDRRAAISSLAEQGRFVTEIKVGGDVERSGSRTEAAGAGFAGRVSSRDVLEMTKQLSAALKAGLSVMDAIKIIAQQQPKPKMRQLLENLGSSVSGGKGLSEAMSESPELFSPLYVSMIRAGETAGILEQTIEQLCGLLDREEKIKSKIKGALAYPLFVLFVGVVSVVIVLTKVMPRIIDTLGGGRAGLPAITDMLMTVSDFLTGAGGLILLAAIIFGSLVFVKWKKTPAGRLSWDGIKLRLPIFGGVVRAISVGRFARTLGALTAGGITILHALSVVRDTLGNEVLGRSIDHVAEKVKTGSSLAEPLAETGLFPPLLIQIVSVGEHTGKIDELLVHAADTFDEQADGAIQRFMAIFPSLMIVVLGVIIGFIIMATLLPIMSMDFSM